MCTHANACPDCFCYFGDCMTTYPKGNDQTQSAEAYGYCSSSWLPFRWYKLIFCELNKTSNMFVRKTISPTAPIWSYIFDQFDIEEWPDFDLSPLKICSSMRYTYMPNIKLLSSILQKLLQIVKFDTTYNQTNKQTNQQTDRQTDQQTGQKQYVPHYRVGDIITTPHSLNWHL